MCSAFSPTAPTANKLLPEHDDQPLLEDGMYGPRGWSVEAGVWKVLNHWPDQLRDLSELLGQAPGPAQKGCLEASGWPQEDYVPFAGLDARGAAALLDALPARALADRQNLAPSLRTLLHACASGKGRVRLSGYAIGPQRRDERVSVEAIWVSDPALAGFAVSTSHTPGCDCHALWEEVRVRYQLDAEDMPDEILRLAPAWAKGQEGWWFWWD
ncbi:Uncharacterised protein [Actinomyces bovis]|uniref:DUF4253 domain-containing protein n=1 Tax=Actinomyces bovis TaxID=1658 RepID=A0ABY1VL28_9ACTO|nr:hypothetical protein [Actinomyces bovis]SPT52462.1 Uncharacterised protein [Actinomyces bovis]VEG54135.1 Uncharacterised protein [Actinomyces israelii]